MSGVCVQNAPSTFTRTSERSVMETPQLRSSQAACRRPPAGWGKKTEIKNAADVWLGAPDSCPSEPAVFLPLALVTTKTGTRPPFTASVLGPSDVVCVYSLNTHKLSGSPPLPPPCAPVHSRGGCRCWGRVPLYQWTWMRGGDQEGGGGGGGEGEGRRGGREKFIDHQQVAEGRQVQRPVG